MKPEKIAISKILGSSNGRPNQSFPSEIPPYFIWVRETDRGRWVRWLRVKNFSNSDEKDQHYLIDRGAGTIRFSKGDSVRMCLTGEGMAILSWPRQSLIIISI